MILRFKEFIKEAIVKFDAPNFSPKTVAQSLPATHHDKDLPRHRETDATGNTENILVFSNVTGDHYDYYQLQDILNKYSIYCKQQGEDCDIDSINDTQTLDSILSKIDY